MTEDPVRRGGATTTRSFSAPTRAEAEGLATQTIASFSIAGWKVAERLWIPGDRRPSLTESLLLSPQSENLLEANGTLRISFVNDAADAVVPDVAPTTRTPDRFESLAGTRYRRLAPRWILGGVVVLITLVIMFSMIGNMGGGFPGFGAPTPDPDGICPLGWLPGWTSDSSGTITSRFCTRLGP